MRKILWCLALFSCPFFSEAAEHVSGYINLKCLHGYTYQATIVDYTSLYPGYPNQCDTTMNDGDTSLILNWGDGTSDTLHRSREFSICSCIKANIFIGTHTFSAPGTFCIWFFGVGRMAGIANMNNSKNQLIYIFNTLTIPSFIGYTFSSPVIDSNPVCSTGCPRECYFYNPDAISPGGDSLSYSLGPCLSERGIQSNGYYIPSNVSIDPITGKLSWCSNKYSAGTDSNLFNFSIRITSYVKEIISGHPYQIPVDTEEMEVELDADTNCPLGEEELKVENGDLKVYPNPNNGKFNLQIDNAQWIMDNDKIEIYNTYGQLIYSKTIHYPLST